ncbi:Protein of unknown function [Bacillus thuringiensis]|uniref:Uncharacterized protein n=1 Tax=Bacillus thuringiensis TaxID=1428 RepID=A0A1C4GF03_BACTU|nr:Protein of unknown function [Bacillus thuringiensis]
MNGGFGWGSGDLSKSLTESSVGGASIGFSSGFVNIFSIPLVGLFSYNMLWGIYGISFVLLCR